MNYTKCVECGRIKFRNITDKKTIWIMPDESEKLILDFILKSQLLITVVNGVKIYGETCPECKQAKNN